MRACTRDRGRQIQTRAKAGMRAVAGEHRVMGRGWHPFKEAPPGGMLRSHEPPPQDAACDARLHTATSPAKRSIFGIAGE